MMHNPDIQTKVLFVDDEASMRELMVDVAHFAGVEDFEAYDRADAVVARIQSLEEPAAGIISDGLNGGWREVIVAAHAARIPAVVLSGDRDLKDEVEATGADFLAKPASISVIKAVMQGFVQ